MQPKDLTKPKGPCSAYIMFTTEQMNKMKKPNSDYMNKDGTNINDPKTGEPYKHTALMSVAAGKWNDLSDNYKEVY